MAKRSLHTKAKVSLAAFKGKAAPRQKPIFWQWSRGKAVMKGKWKLVAWKDKWELFDMSKDKTETTDLSGKISRK